MQQRYNQKDRKIKNDQEPYIKIANTINMSYISHGCPDGSQKYLMIVQYKYLINILNFDNIKIYINNIQSAHMKSQQDIKQKNEFQEYYMIKKSIILPPKISILFSILEKVHLSPNQCANINNQPNRCFLLAFHKLNKIQQAHFLHQCMKFVVKYLTKKQSQVIPKNKYIIRNIQTTVEVYSTYFKIPVWYSYTFKLDKQKNIIVLGTKKKNQTIDLKNYLVRRSKKFKGSIALDSAVQEENFQNKKRILYFKGNLGQEMYQQLMDSVINIKLSELEQLLINHLPQKLNKKEIYHSILTLNKINQFIQYKESTRRYLSSTKQDFRQISLPRKQFSIQQSFTNFKLFRLQGILQIEAKQAKNKFLVNLGSTRNKIIISSQIIEKISNKYIAVYEKYLFNNNLQEMICIREQNINDQYQVVFIRGVDNLIINSFLQFLTVRIYPTSQRQSKILMLCSIKLNQFITPENVKLYLYTLYLNASWSKCQKLINDPILPMIEEQSTMMANRNQYTYANGNFYQGGNNKQIIIQFQQQEVSSLPCQSNIHSNPQVQMKQTKQVEQSKNIIKSCITNKYILSPIPIQNIQISDYLTKKHPLFTEWIRKKDGGVLCQNQQITQKQKKLFKELIIKYGNDFFRNGHNVFSLSLPISFFKKQSHLESIAKSLCYAPILLENKSQQLQRMKSAVIFAISVGLMSVGLQMPIKPRLGETIQAWIADCPIYLQQISLDPFICSYYFLGRGYKIFGKIQPKISFGMNNIKGYSERPNYILFDDGTEIEIIYGKMIITGTIFGEREFNFDEKIYAYNKKQNMFAQINYVGRKNSIIQKQTEPQDYCFGSIYQVKEQFLSIFKKSTPKIYPTERYILKKLSNFSGVWNQAIKFEEVQYINFTKCFPCQLVSQSFPLPSNSNYRIDISQLIQGNIQNSQRENDVIQQLQRSDKKLRQLTKQKNGFKKISQNELMVKNSQQQF